MRQVGFGEAVDILRQAPRLLQIPSGNCLYCIARGDKQGEPATAARLKRKKVRRVERVERVTRYLPIEQAKDCCKAKVTECRSSTTMLPKTFNVTGNCSSDDQSYNYKSGKKKDCDNRSHRSQSEPPKHLKNGRGCPRANEDFVSVGRVGNVGNIC